MGSEAGRPDALPGPVRVGVYHAVSQKTTRLKIECAYACRAIWICNGFFVELKPAIDAFFTAVMVNADDQAVRSNRLSLLQEVDDFFNSFADFSQIVVQGS